MSAAAAIVPSRLRVAVVASDGATRSRLQALVVQSGHEAVEMATCADATLTDGTNDEVAPSAAVAVGAIEGEFAGLLPPDPTAAQVDAALRAVAAGLTVRAGSPRYRNATAPHTARIASQSPYHRR